MRFFLVITFFMSICSTAFSWGGRGHQAICATAVYLVKEPGLKNYLKNYPHMMGHLCNMPDFHWKSLGGEANQLGNPTHFVDLEVLDVAPEKIGTDYKKLQKQFTGKANAFYKGKNIQSLPQDFGSSWWRTEQFMKRIAGLKKDFSKSKPPKDRQQEQDNSLPFNKASYEMLVNMGLMGHFVGDNAQPFHTSADYDGYQAGHGGIHSFYEEDVVGEFDGDLESLILTAARKIENPPFIKGKNSIEKMKALSLISHKEIAEVLKLDPIVKPSVVKEEKGMQLRTKAERKSATVAFEKMQPYIVNQMARGSLLLAHLWDEAYKSAGRPKIEMYKSYKYPFTVDFVAPDYHD